MDKSFLIFFLALLWQPGDARTVVGITIHSYSNPNGTAFVDASSDQKCCDPPQRASCSTGDTCDTYFDICVGQMQNQVCSGAFFQTKPLTNTNNISNVPEMEAVSDSWHQQAEVLVLIRDDDSLGPIKKYDHIDTLTQPTDIKPGAVQLLGSPEELEWGGKISMTLSIRAWCDQNYFGSDCSVFCLGIFPMAMCNRANGTLTCSNYADELLLEFQTKMTGDILPVLTGGLTRFAQNYICASANDTTVEYARLDVKSNTLSFTAVCAGHEVTAIEFESILLLQNDTVLSQYFPSPVVRGPPGSPRSHGQNSSPNVYFGVEILDAQHPTSTSYVGTNTSGARRCCDGPSSASCQTGDLCDMVFSICIGSQVGGSCTGALVQSAVYANSTSLHTCGATLLDFTQGRAFPQHPMIGAMTLTTNTTTLYVTVKDSDQNGTSFDVIDVMNTTVSIQPSQNVSQAVSVTFQLQNIVTLKLKVIAWCAPGYSGPNCLPPSGKVACFPGWTGDNCNQRMSPCNPNPCQHSTSCSVTGTDFTCTCLPGYKGKTCSEDKNECLLSVCQNNGTCHNTVGSFSCSCPSGWTGAVCVDKVPECTPSPCLHGTCQPGAPAPLCTCSTGWTGSKCSQDINECLKDPCFNNGQCTNFDGGFSCSCAPGFTGKTCQTNINDCVPSACSNHGTCIDGVTNFTCVCDRGYMGMRCGQTVDYCARVTCAHGSQCQQKNMDFQCQCPSGWSGKVCDVDVNECKKSPCRHQGGCVNTPGTYSCSCAAGWLGVLCEAQNGTIAAQSGSSYSATFSSAITAAVEGGLVSAIYNAVAQHLCNGTTVIAITAVRNTSLQFSSSCNNASLSMPALKKVLAAAQLPLPFVSLQAVPAGRAGSKSWVSSHWPVVAGCSVAVLVVIVVVAVGLVCARNRRLKNEEDDKGFSNPAFSDDYRNRYEYD